MDCIWPDFQWRQNTTNALSGNQLTLKTIQLFLVITMDYELNQS